MTTPVPALLRTLTADPGRPRCTWYGPDGERIELSGAVLTNWVSKTANLLADEVDAGPGTRIAVALPGHWRTLVWLLGTWAVGAEAVVVEPGTSVPAGCAAVVTDRPRAHGASAGPGGPIVVAVALPALATTAGELPSGAIDAAAEVRLQPDAFAPRARPDVEDAAFTAVGGTVPYGELAPAARAAAEAAGWAAGDRLLVGTGPDQALGAWLGPLLLDGSLVLHHDLAGLDDAARAALVRQEAVTAVGT